jgi:hypothetical protein
MKPLLFAAFSLALTLSAVNAQPIASVTTAGVPAGLLLGRQRAIRVNG